MVSFIRRRCFVRGDKHGMQAIVQDDDENAQPTCRINYLRHCRKWKNKVPRKYSDEKMYYFEIRRQCWASHTAVFVFATMVEQTHTCCEPIIHEYNR